MSIENKADPWGLPEGWTFEVTIDCGFLDTVYADSLEGNVALAVDDGNLWVDRSSAPVEVVAAVLRRAGWTVVPPEGGGR